MKENRQLPPQEEPPDKFNMTPTRREVLAFAGSFAAGAAAIKFFRRLFKNTEAGEREIVVQKDLEKGIADVGRLVYEANRQLPRIFELKKQAEKYLRSGLQHQDKNFEGFAAQMKAADAAHFEVYNLIPIKRGQVSGLFLELEALRPNDEELKSLKKRWEGEMDQFFESH